MDYDSIIKAQTCIHEGLLNRLSEDERASLLAEVNFITMGSGTEVGRTASKGLYGLQAAAPTVVYQMSKEARERWAPRIDGMTNRIAGTATIVHLKLEEGTP